jgi:hypothetical protein
MGLIFNHLFVFLLSVSNYLVLGSGLPARTLPYAIPCFCLGSSWAPCHWLLLLGRVGAAFIERRLSLMILFIMFFVFYSWFFYLHINENMMSDLTASHSKSFQTDH